ncbi:MAG: cell division protein ZapA [Bacteroidetes bacterium]|nr:cell division protein ZapA [Bacteroidota bacterium]
MKEQFISVIIADRPYRLSVTSEEEEISLREAGKRINEKLQEFAANYAFRDKQDLLAMVGLQISVELLSSEKKVEYQQPLKEKLVNIDKLLNSYLEK